MTRPPRIAPSTRLAVLFVLIVTAFGLALAQSPAPASKVAQAPAAAKKAWPLTRPEATGFHETSRYDDVQSFMNAMAAASPQIHLVTVGYSYEGRPMRMAVIGAPGATAEQVLATKKTRIYIQGNIHAGEVEGKEALLWLLRSIAKGERAAWFNSVVLLINPLYNADGNERVLLTNRGSQAGPVGGMGQRPNAQNLDLNRDCVKLEAPEPRSLARLLTDYDPHVAIDLHTTDGSSDNGFYLTYETSLNPNDSRATFSLLRDQLLPTVTKNVKAKHGWSYFYYGGVGGRGGSGERAWRSDADLAHPRYTSTYFGVRNKLGILIETYSYATFEDRIKATYWFLEEAIDFVTKNNDTVKKAVATAESESVIGKQLAVRQELVKAPEPKEIVFAQSVSQRNPYVPDRPMRVRVPGGETTEMLPFYGTTQPTETSMAPRYYVLPNAPAPAPSAAPAAPAAAPPAGAPPVGGPPTGAPPGGGRGGQGPGGFGGGRGGPGGSPSARVIASVTDRLEAHGIKFIRTDKDIAFKGERFHIETNTQAPNEFQGAAPHKLRTLTGKWEPTEQTLPAGSLIIPMNQPLARLAFILFDARSDDSFMAWNILDPILGATPAPEFYPVLRTLEELGIK